MPWVERTATLNINEIPLISILCSLFHPGSESDKRDILDFLTLKNMEHVKLIEDVRIVVTVHNSGKCTVTYYLPLGMFGDDFVKFKIRNKEEIKKLKQYEKEDIQKLSPTDSVFNQCVAH